MRRSPLSVPSTFEEKNIPSGSTPPHGIISRLRNETSDITSYVQPSSKHDYIGGDVNTLVKWNTYVQIHGDDAYLQVEFKQGYVFPLSYSLRGHNGPHAFAKEWYLYGFNEVDGEKTLLNEASNEGTTFCGNESLCYNGIIIKAGDFSSCTPIPFYR